MSPAETLNSMQANVQTNDNINKTVCHAEEKKTKINVMAPAEALNSMQANVQTNNNINKAVYHIAKGGTWEWQ